MQASKPMFASAGLSEEHAALCAECCEAHKIDPAALLALIQKIIANAPAGLALVMQLIALFKTPAKQDA